MRHHGLIAVLTAGSVVLLVTGCEGPARVSGPPRIAASTSGEFSASPGAHPVELLDQCDPTSFNAAVGPGTCMSGHHGIEFSTFIKQLTENQNAPAWRNAPSNMSAAFGTTLVAVNRGGEVHTFTHVAAFGGGVVPLLNEVAGTPTPAPECLAAKPNEFLLPGATDAEAVSTHGTALYQCCIHPWMRTTVAVR
jgi:hypothetical protein